MITDFSFICIGAVSGDQSKQKMYSTLLKRQAFWCAQLFTLQLTVLTKGKNINLNLSILIEVGIRLYQIAGFTEFFYKHIFKSFQLITIHSNTTNLSFLAPFTLLLVVPRVNFWVPFLFLFFSSRCD